MTSRLRLRGSWTQPLQELGPWLESNRPLASVPVLGLAYLVVQTGPDARCKLDLEGISSPAEI
jgi:hypothetical protein